MAHISTNVRILQKQTKKKKKEGKKGRMKGRTNTMNNMRKEKN